MAQYQGLNQEELRGEGRSQENLSYIAPETAMRPYLSFTPINLNRSKSLNPISPLTRTIDPLRILRNTDVYDLPEDVPSPPTPGGKKRRTPRSKNGPTKILPNAKSHTNTTVEDCDTELFEVASPKRRKILTKGAQPAFKVPSRVKTIPAHQDLEKPPNKLGDGPSVSQLFTPPDTHKRSKKRALSATVTKRKKSSELFQNSTVTKPSLSCFTSKSSREQSQPINRLQGFTTTEEQMKRNSNGIANTTLQKLAAFRYVPREENLLANQSITASKGDDTHLTLDKHRDGYVFEESNHTSSEYGHISSGSFFEEALWISKQSVDSNEPDTIRINQLQTRPFSENLLASVTQQKVFQIGHSLNQTIGSSAFGEGIPEDALKNPTNNDVDRQQSQLVPTTIDNSVTTELGDMTSELPEYNKHLPEVNDQLPNTGFEQEQPQNSQQSLALLPTISAETYHNDNHSELPVIEEGMLTIINPPLDCFDSDSFGDDIDDEDLLALDADPAILECPMRDEVIQSIPKQPCSPSISHIVSSLRTRTTQLHDPVTLSQEVTRATSPPIVADEVDDFPMDTDLEEELFRLAGTSQFQGVVESFEPPSSLTLPRDGDDTDREVYDDNLQFSSPTPREPYSNGIALVKSTDKSSPSKPPATQEDADWRFITSTALRSVKAPVIQSSEALIQPLKNRRLEKLSTPVQSIQTNISKMWLDDSDDYLPLTPFARPKFPQIVQDRCPINGLSSQTILRVCFRIGEMLKEGGRCNALGQDAIIELFARVNFSSREPGTTKQHFQFSDLFHDRPPFAKGILANFKTSGLAESESRIFIESSESLMARCLGRVKKDVKNGSWLLHIINVRVTDWEEIRWTKRIVCGEREEEVDVKTTATIANL
ncbi:uncharacterized protein EAF02_001310 [Botrytis sinoallii]|uniref:uncharacterized protein n=1 Tax=Botrytis sinoallii TaxID=1463999 RepID=UPI0019023730|nr:uncharacterized protein EAF02_001310 [Botrytis sinoallii]KAF7890985.1 hypothetical protein EAF02_001310 [Botrytis sinoallii]